MGRKVFHRNVRTIAADDQEGPGQGALRRARRQWTQDTGQSPERFGMGVPISPLRPSQYLDAIWRATALGCGPRILCPPRPEGNWGEVHEQDNDGRPWWAAQYETAFNAVTSFSAWRWTTRGAPGSSRSTQR